MFWWLSSGMPSAAVAHVERQSDAVRAFFSRLTRLQKHLAGGRELNGVRQEILQHLTQAAGIAEERRRRTASDPARPVPLSLRWACTAYALREWSTSEIKSKRSLRHFQLAGLILEKSRMSFKTGQ
jgi:hypothetical protein